MDGEFAGTEFRDEKTKIMFAYDYENKHTIRLCQGANIRKNYRIYLFSAEMSIKYELSL